MAYSGAWKQSSAAVDGETRRTHKTRDNWGEGVDPRHGIRTGHDVPSDVDPSLGIPQFQVEIPPAIEDMWNVGAEPPYLPPSDYGAGDDSQEIAGDQGPHEGHNTAPWGVNDARSQEANNLARSADRGMAKQAVRRHVVGRDFSQTYDSGPYESLPASDGNGGNVEGGQAGRAIRGKNALAANNPGSPEVNFSGNYRRQGKEIVRWTNRRMPLRTLQHTKRTLHLNLAATAFPSAAPEGDAYTPYTSPFDGRVTSMVARRQTTMLRREPRPWDEDTVVDGTESDDYATDISQYRSWGL